MVHMVSQIRVGMGIEAGTILWLRGVCSMIRWMSSILLNNAELSGSYSQVYLCTLVASVALVNDIAIVCRMVPGSSKRVSQAV